MALAPTVSEKLRRTAREHSDELEPHEADTLEHIAAAAERRAPASDASEYEGTKAEREHIAKREEALDRVVALRQRLAKGEQLSAAERLYLDSDGVRQLEHEYAMSTRPAYRVGQAQRDREIAARR